MAQAHRAQGLVCRSSQAISAARSAGSVIRCSGILVPGYDYSDALRMMDLVWSPETLSRLFEVGPAAYTPGTKMPEQRISDPADRAALIAWLERQTRP